MPIVALTGGVAAGKTTVTDILAQRGAIVVDADALAREVVAVGSPALHEIQQRFGDSVVDSTGALDREALGAVVFADAAAREALNAIVHPRVRALSAERCGEAAARHPNTVLVYAIPLLAEARSRDEFDLVVLVDAPAAIRAARLVDYRGFSPSEAAARVGAQATDGERLALADLVLDSSGELAVTQQRAVWLYDALLECWPERLSEVPGVYKASQS